ncbi:MAG: RNA-binding domain-containing protein [Mycoplasmatales bacterium]
MENERIEYKLDIIKKDGLYTFLKEIVAFLNSQGGELIFGVDDKGNYVGFKDEEFDKKLEQLQNIIYQSITPNIQTLVEIEEIQNNCIKVIVSNLTKHKPYYITKYGLSPKGVYVRKGSSSIPLADSEIKIMYKNHNNSALSTLKAKHNKYEFRNLSIRFEIQVEKKLSSIKKLNLGIIDEEENITRLGELFADENSNIIDIAVFKGLTKTSNFHIESFGNIPLNEAFEKVINYIELNNTSVITKIRAQREEQKNYNSKAVREAVLNAFIHNDYEVGYPKFTLFIDRLEISSYGGLLPSMSKEAFFKGRSKSRNEDIVKIFKLFKGTESIGRGIPIILEHYKEEIFEILDDELIITFPNKNYQQITKSEEKIAKSKDNIAKSEEKIANSKDNIAKSEDNIAKSEDNMAKSEDKKKVNNQERIIKKEKLLQNIYNYISQKNEVTVKEVSEQYDLSARVTQIYLKELYLKNKLDRKKESKRYLYYKKDKK